jgi:hypothetical protein
MSLSSFLLCITFLRSTYPHKTAFTRTAGFYLLSPVMIVHPLTMKCNCWLHHVSLSQYQSDQLSLGNFHEISYMRFLSQFMNTFHLD